MSISNGERECQHSPDTQYYTDPLYRLTHAVFVSCVCFVGGKKMEGHASLSNNKNSGLQNSDFQFLTLDILTLTRFHRDSTDEAP